MEQAKWQLDKINDNGLNAVDIGIILTLYAHRLLAWMNDEVHQCRDECARFSQKSARGPTFWNALQTFPFKSNRNENHVAKTIENIRTLCLNHSKL